MIDLVPLGVWRILQLEGMDFLITVSVLRVICGLLSGLILGCWHRMCVREGGRNLVAYDLMH
jgi:hypothetical protein